MALYELDGMRPQVPASGGYWIADNATVLGNVVIEEDVGIWFGAILRGDNERMLLKRGCNVQDGSVFHTDPGFPLTVGVDCTIGHMVMLHGCTIGNGSLVGIGAIVLNGAVVGEDCLIGAGALIPEGKVIPPRSLVMGTPGKVVREMADEDIAKLRIAASNYQARWRRYKAKFRPFG
ncbi:MAG: gamma carbonic anhydrase family protein [Hyphomicrobiaceae bacterium]